MSEDFQNLGSYDSDPLDVEPASSETKQALMAEVELKTRGGFYHQNEASSWIGQDLFFTDKPDVTMNVQFTPDGDRKRVNGNTHIGKVIRYTDNQKGQEEVECYDFVLSGDGTIEIEKDHTFNNKREHDEQAERMLEAESMAELLQGAVKQRDRIRKEIEDSQSAKQMGLGFVSQTEANQLLDELQKAQPHG